ncbi:hypothetical protein AAMO2058_000906500 [Amorphochlora amoebiformis]
MKKPFNSVKVKDFEEKDGEMLPPGLGLSKYKPKRTAGGVRIEVIKPGDLTNYPKRGDTLAMHYTGTLESNGKKFDSSRDRGRVFEFMIGVGQVIRGWDEGILMLSLGERAKLYIPSAMAYGPHGAGNDIPPNADLVFDVELVSINGHTLTSLAQSVNSNSYSDVEGKPPGLVKIRDKVLPPMEKKPVPTFDPNDPNAPEGLQDIPASKRAKKEHLLKGRRWARLQVSEKSKKRLQLAEGSDDYNIWYHKYYGDAQDRIREKAQTRCRPKIDSGMTLGDITDNKFICVHFAMGDCTHGADCKFLHRLPTLADEKYISHLNDIFGRERHNEHSENMGGVGSFLKNTRTLYVTGMAVMSSPQGDEILARHFGEWGEIEEISLKPKYGCAFVRFTHRFYAEFAKIAMAEQSLDHGEQINCRWAYDDPNPKAGIRKKWENEQKLKDRLEELGYSHRGEAVGYDMPANYNPSYTQNLTTYGKQSEMYPSTDNQYQANSEYYNQYYQNFQNYYKQFSQNGYLPANTDLGQGAAEDTRGQTRGTKRKQSEIGPMAPDTMRAQKERKRAESQQQYAAKIATQYVQQQLNAMNKLDSVLNVIDNFAGYNDDNKKGIGGSSGSRVTGEKKSGHEELEAFMASIKSMSKTSKK